MKFAELERQTGTRRVADEDGTMADGGKPRWQRSILTHLAPEESLPQ